MKEKLLKITDFSKATGLSLKALRLYEAYGILVPQRSATNRYRLYDESQKELAKEISTLRRTGFSLQEIKALLPFRETSQGTLELFRTQFAKNQQTIEALLIQQEQLQKMIETSGLQFFHPFGIGANSLGRQLICGNLSASIKKLSEHEVLTLTKQIKNEDYLRTLAMVDDFARAKLLSVLSENAKKLVESDLAELDREYARFWA